MSVVSEWLRSDAALAPRQDCSARQPVACRFKVAAVDLDDAFYLLETIPTPYAQVQIDRRRKSRQRSGQPHHLPGFVLTEASRAMLFPQPAQAPTLRYLGSPILLRSALGTAVDGASTRLDQELRGNSGLPHPLLPSTLKMFELLRIISGSTHSRSCDFRMRNERCFHTKVLQ